MIIIAHILFYFFFIVIVFVVLRFHSSKMKGETWSAPRLIGFLWPVISQMRKPLKQASDSRVYSMWPYQ